MKLEFPRPAIRPVIREDALILSAAALLVLLLAIALPALANTPPPAQVIKHKDGVITTVQPQVDGSVSVVNPRLYIDQKLFDVAVPKREVSGAISDASAEAPRLHGICQGFGYKGAKLASSQFARFGEPKKEDGKYAVLRRNEQGKFVYDVIKHDGTGDPYGYYAISEIQCVK